ncbi:unnamed protein product [Ambrosiozyma monospora]|uniref:Unnamed protein product n=2 Tax=Ambrosiozyma monospora TaxID=43982 RepID=A0ACB5T3J4_AMBMO|nr:unnamed protein product [Ambrosiozyma monospora]
MSLSYLELVERADSVPHRDEVEKYASFKSQVYTFIAHDGKHELGYILPLVVEKLSEHPDVVTIDQFARTVRLNPSLNTVESRSDALMSIAEEWKENGTFKFLKGWRNEPLTIFDEFRKPYMHLERVLCPLLGVVMYGILVNGYVVDKETGEKKLWVSKRSETKPTYPGQHDALAGGGIGYPYGIWETAYKECFEEAGINKDYLEKHTRSAGLISYLYQKKKDDFTTEGGYVRPEVAYVFDFEMGEDVIPRPVDNEASGFELLSFPEVAQRLKEGRFKYNSGASIVDFFIRHGFITPENEPEYINIIGKLHRLLPFPLK